MKTQTIVGGQLYVGPKGASIKEVILVSSTEKESTYKIMLDNGEEAGRFTVQNGTIGHDGNGISSISGPTTSGLQDTYTIHFTNGSSTNFIVTNGKIGKDGAKGDKGDKGDTGSVADIISDGTTGNVITALSLNAEKEIVYKKELNALTYLNNKVTVAGAKKDLAKVSPTAVYFPNGIVMGGTAAAAGLTTRGITGITTPDANGNCSKEHLYVNYDGNGDSHYTHKLVLGAGSVGTTIPGSTPTNATAATTFTAVRGDQMVAYAMPKAGGTFTGPINFPNATALPQKDLIYICGIDGFADSTKGQMGWQAKSAFLAGYATQSWVRDTAIAHQATSTTGTLTFTGASTATFNGNNNPVVHIPNDAITFSTDPTAKGQILRSMTIGGTTWIIAGTDNNIGVTYEEI